MVEQVNGKEGMEGKREDRIAGITHNKTASARGERITRKWLMEKYDVLLVV